MRLKTWEGRREPVNSSTAATTSAVLPGAAVPSGSRRLSSSLTRGETRARPRAPLSATRSRPDCTAARTGAARRRPARPSTVSMPSATARASASPCSSISRRMGSARKLRPRAVRHSALAILASAASTPTPRRSRRSVTAGAPCSERLTEARSGSSRQPSMQASVRFASPSIQIPCGHVDKRVGVGPAHGYHRRIHGRRRQALPPVLVVGVQIQLGRARRDARRRATRHGGCYQPWRRVLA